MRKDATINELLFFRKNLVFGIAPGKCWIAPVGASATQQIINQSVIIEVVGDEDLCIDGGLVESIGSGVGYDLEAVFRNIPGLFDQNLVYAVTR